MTFCLTTSAQAERRVALVIGNGAYEHASPLVNPGNDARDLAIKLESLGFEVVTGFDLTLPQTRSVIKQFISQLSGADLSLFYYAGHGLQVNGENYIAPIDATLRSDVFLNFETILVDDVIEAMEKSTKTNLVFLDACRDNPLAERLARSMGTRSNSIGRGLAKISTGVGTLIAFSTQPGNVALDGDGRNSPYATALLKHLGSPGRDISAELVAVRNDVLKATDGKQVPWENSSLTGAVVLSPAEAPSQSVAVPTRPKSDISVELAFWDSVKDMNSTGGFRAYLQRWPNGIFVDLAKLKLDELEGANRQVDVEPDADLMSRLAAAEAEVEKQKALQKEAEEAQKALRRAQQELSNAKEKLQEQQRLQAEADRARAALDEANSELEKLRNRSHRPQGMPINGADGEQVVDKQSELKVAAIDPRQCGRFDSGIGLRIPEAFSM